VFYYFHLRYYKRYCPHCHFHWTSVLFPALLHFGPETKPCKRCGAQIPTGWKEWRLFSESEMRRFFIEGWQAALIVWGTGLAIRFVKGYDNEVWVWWSCIWLAVVLLVLAQRGVRIGLSRWRFRLSGRREVEKEPIEPNRAIRKPLVATSKEEWQHVISKQCPPR